MAEVNRTARECEAARLPASGLTTQQRGIGSGQVAVPAAGRGPAASCVSITQHGVALL